MTPSILRELEEWHEEGDKSVIENTAGYRSPEEDGIIRVVAKNYTYEKLRQSEYGRGPIILVDITLIGRFRAVNDLQSSCLVQWEGRCYDFRA